RGALKAPHFYIHKRHLKVVLKILNGGGRETRTLDLGVMSAALLTS
ncbi:MAG: hypothetical protein ACD_81C00188G0018, partial [uncultured bacterium]